MDSMSNMYLEKPWKGFDPEAIRSMQMRLYRRAMLTTSMKVVVKRKARGSFARSGERVFV